MYKRGERQVNQLINVQERWESTNWLMYKRGQQQLINVQERQVNQLINDKRGERQVNQLINVQERWKTSQPTD